MRAHLHARREVLQIRLQMPLFAHSWVASRHTKGLDFGDPCATLEVMPMWPGTTGCYSSHVAEHLHPVPFCHSSLGEFLWDESPRQSLSTNVYSVQRQSFADWLCRTMHPVVVTFAASTFSGPPELAMPVTIV